MTDAFKEWDAKFAARSQKEPERVNTDKYLVRELEKLVEELKAELGACRASPKNTTAREKRLLEKLEACRKVKRGVKKGSPKAIAAAERVAAKRAGGKRKKSKRGPDGAKYTYSGQKRSEKGQGSYGALDSLGAALQKARRAAKRTVKKAAGAVAAAPKAAAKAVAKTAKKAAKVVTGSPKNGAKKGGSKKGGTGCGPKSPKFRGGSAAQNKKAICEEKAGRRNPNTGRLYTDKARKK